MSELPEGWIETPFLDVIDYEGGAQPPKKVFVFKPKPGYVRLLQIRDFGEKPFPTFVPDTGRLKKAKADDLLLARYGGGEGDDCLGRVCTGLAGAYNVALVKLIFSREHLHPGFVRAFFLGPWFRAAIGTNSRSCQLGFNRSDLKWLTFPLPPLAEQQRMVAKVEELLARVNAARARLAHVPALLKRFRQSVLAAACAGKLTKNLGTEGNGEDELPAGWQWVELDSLLPERGIFDGPFGSNLKTSDYTDSGVRVVRLENIGHLRFKEEKETYISPEKYETLKKHTVGNGDIIFASFIEEEIRACVLPKLKTKTIAKADCFCLRPRQDLVDRTYLTYQLVSPASYDQLVGDIHGATRPRINVKRLRKLMVRVCPMPEQREIVRRVEGLMGLAAAIEQRLCSATARADQLTPAILGKAFRGELVPPACRQAGKTPDTLPPPRPGVWFVYVIECKDGSFYKGFTDDLPRRWRQHVASTAAEWTKQHPPKQVFYWEECYSETGAVKREQYLKSGIGREWFKHEVVDRPEAWEPASALLERIRKERSGLQVGTARRAVRRRLTN